MNTDDAIQKIMALEKPESEDGNTDQVTLPLQEDEFSDATISLSNGEAFEADEINDFLKLDLARVIVLLGPIGVGKSTLISNIYNHFIADGTFADYEFVASPNLIGFERKSYISRATSKAGPDTKRSPVDGHYFICLKLKNKITQSCRNIVITDIPGELFDKLIINENKIDSSLGFMRMDYCCLFANSEKICSKKYRRLIKSDLQVLCQHLKQSKMLSKNFTLQIIYTKCDKIEQSSADEFKKFSDELEASIHEIFESNDLNAYKINSWSDCEQIKLLFSSWLDEEICHEYI